MDTLLKGESMDLPEIYAIVQTISIFNITVRKSHVFQKAHWSYAEINRKSALVRCKVFSATSPIQRGETPE